MYKGFRVEEVILHDYEYPLKAVLIDAPCGCRQCEEVGEVQIGHSQCGIIPLELQGDPSVSARLEHGWGWVLEFVGSTDYIDRLAQ
jgi:hypothetical protein